MILSKDTVMFQRVTTYLGRNGTMKCIGIDMYENGNDIIITPINSKLQAASCGITFPQENIQDIIDLLSKLKHTNP